MNKIVKGMVIFVSLIALFAILLLISLVTFVNPNRFKPLLTAKIQQYTGHQLIIDGNLSWTLFPMFGVKTGHVTLKNPVGFDQGIFAEINDVTVSVKLLPLLSKKIESNGIRLDGMKLNLVTNSQGQKNWNFQEKSANVIKNVDTGNQVKHSPMLVAILGLDISNSQIFWKDEQKKQYINVDKFNVHASKINLLNPFPISSSFIATHVGNHSKCDVKLKADAAINTNAQIFSFRNVEIITHHQQTKQLTSVTFTGDIMMDLLKQTLQWENFHAKSGKLSLNGKINITNLMTDPVTTGYLKMSPIDIRKWLQDNGRDVISIQSLKNVTADINFIPVAKSIAFKGNMTADEFIVNHVKMSNLTIPLYYQHSILSLTPIHAFFYGGKWASNIKVDLNNTIPHITIDSTLTNFNLLALMQDLSPKQKLSFGGKGNLNLQATSRGSDKQSILKNLNGTGHFNFNDGVLQGVDVNYLISSASAMIAKKITAEVNTKQTTFKEVKGSFNIQNGIIINKDLIMISNDFSTKGQGVINLVNQTMDYHLQTFLNQPMQLDKKALTHLPIPVRIEGHLNAPSIYLDIDELTKAIAEQQVQKVKSQLQERIEKGKIPEKAGNFLKNLLGR